MATIDLTAAELEILFGALSQAVHRPMGATRAEEIRMRAERGLREYIGRAALEAGSAGDGRAPRASEIPHLLDPKEWARVKACYG